MAAKVESNSPKGLPALEATQYDGDMSAQSTVQISSCAVKRQVLYEGVECAMRVEVESRSEVGDCVKVSDSES